eukprot:RCo052083
MSFHPSESSGDTGSVKDDVSVSSRRQSGLEVPPPGTAHSKHRPSSSKYCPGSAESPSSRHALAPPRDDMAPPQDSCVDGVVMPVPSMPSNAKVFTSTAPAVAASPPEEEDKPRGPVASFFLSLRFLLAAFCVVAIFVAAFLAWYLTYTTGLDTVQSLSKEFEMQLLPQIAESIVSRLARAEAMAQVNKELWRRGTYSLDPQSYLPTFHALLDSKFTSTVTFTSATGGLYGHFRHPQGAYTSVWLYDEATKNQTEWYTNAAGDPTSLSWSTPDTDNTQANWYVLVNASDPNFVGWTDQYLWFGRFWLTHGTGVYSPTGTFLGVAGVDLELGFLNQLLVSLNLQKGYSIFIVDALAKSVVAAFPPLELVKCTGGTGTDCDGGTLEKVAPGDLHSASVDGIFSTVKAQFGAWLAVRPGLLSITVSGDPYYCAMMPIAQSNIRWTAVLLVEQNVLLEPIYAKTKVVLGTVFGITGGFVVISLLFAVALAKPLSALAEQMGMLSSLDSGALAQAHFPHSILTEVRTLTQTFVVLTKCLAEYRKFMPESLFTKEESHDDEALADAEGSGGEGKGKHGRSGSASSAEKMVKPDHGSSSDGSSR